MVQIKLNSMMWQRHIKHSMPNRVAKEVYAQSNFSGKS